MTWTTQYKLASQSACNALMRRCFHRVVMLYALLILKNVLVEQMVFYPFCLKSKYYLLSFWFNFMALLTSLIVIWNEGIIDFKSFDKSIVFRFSLTRPRTDQCYRVELIAQLHNIILCRKINKDPKADHTLEFTPLILPHKNNWKRDCFSCVISRSPRTTQRGVWNIMKLERRFIDSLIGRQSPSVLILSQWNSKAIIEWAQIKAEIFLDLNGFKTHPLSLTLALSSVIFYDFVCHAGYRKSPSRRFFKSNPFSPFRYFQGLKLCTKTLPQTGFYVQTKTQ